MQTSPDFVDGRFSHTYYWRTIFDETDEGDFVIYGLRSPSFSYWIVPGTAPEAP